MTDLCKVENFMDWMNRGHDKFVSEHKDSFYKKHRMTERLVLANGVSLSIQASNFHYCYPRTNLTDYNEYECFEIGYPSEKLPLVFDTYCENLSKPTDTVYSNVPKGLIHNYIQGIGGGVVGLQPQKDFDEICKQKEIDLVKEQLSQCTFEA